ncbi:saccharopine dehydrogenase family protein [Thermococcus gorgonarius]|uniref:Saccharopine dehydrogenase n=1 Tax=Thermococcus gorgonarius TaxID=71997 RepID=A0A2Z2MFG3_THEGO|nr:saccharopine dehydrogenase family protein [Thermococcus gorgonarius]ASJ00728.1 saccharopine dehydrogenase [Thermococcus gorgonarius]
MKVLVLGAGNIGKAVAYDLRDEFDVYVADISKERLDAVKEFATPIKLDASRFDDLVEALRKFELAVGTLPGNLGYSVVKAALKAGTDLVDVSFMPENPLELRDKAEEARVTVIFDAGFAPGLSHILMGRLWAELDTLEEGLIYVGGLPKHPRPPLYYRITWSPKDLIEEYVRKARVTRNGEILEIDPLSEVRKVRIKNMEFEAFPSDGLRSLLWSVRAKKLEEWTLRWPGHLEKIKVLRELGFFEEKNLDFTLNVIAPLMTYESPDFSIMEVLARGILNGKMTTGRYLVYDEEKDGLSSMSRLTGFTASSVARIVSESSCIYGVIPPEMLGMRIDTFNRILEDLKDRGVMIEGGIENASPDNS